MKGDVQEFRNRTDASPAEEDSNAVMWLVPVEKQRLLLKRYSLRLCLAVTRPCVVRRGFCDTENDEGYEKRNLGYGKDKEGSQGAGLRVCPACLLIAHYSGEHGGRSMSKMNQYFRDK